MIRLRVAYHETITKDAYTRYIFDREINGHPVYAAVALRVVHVEEKSHEKSSTKPKNAIEESNADVSDYEAAMRQHAESRNVSVEFAGDVVKSTSKDAKPKFPVQMRNAIREGVEGALTRYNLELFFFFFSICLLFFFSFTLLKKI